MKTKLIALSLLLGLGAGADTVRKFSGECRYTNVNTGKTLSQPFTMELDAEKRIGIPVKRIHNHPGLFSIVVRGFAELKRVGDEEVLSLGYTDHSGEPYVTLYGHSELANPQPGNKLRFIQQFPYGPQLRCTGTVE